MAPKLLFVQALGPNGTVKERQEQLAKLRQHSATVAYARKWRLQAHEIRKFDEDVNITSKKLSNIKSLPLSIHTCPTPPHLPSLERTNIGKSSTA
jgi:hypothetical protein